MTLFQEKDIHKNVYPSLTERYTQHRVLLETPTDINGKPAEYAIANCAHFLVEIHVRHSIILENKISHQKHNTQVLWTTSSQPEIHADDVS